MALLDLIAAFFLVLDVTFAAVATSRGCSRFAPDRIHKTVYPETLNLRSIAGGGERTFLVHLPEDYDEAAETGNPYPLILAFHGKGQTAEQFAAQALLHNGKSQTHGGNIVVYPAGIDKQWTGDPTAPPTNQVDDVAFAVDLLDFLEARLCIDTTRLYVTGFSNGGGLTHLLACDPTFSARIAAVAIASGAFYKDSALKEPLFNSAMCKPAHAMPVLEFHGEKDPVEHYNGTDTPDGESWAIEEWLWQWAERNGCSVEAFFKQGSEQMLFNSRVQRHSWSCTAKGKGGSDGKGEDVLHYWISGFGHGWPSAVAFPGEDEKQRYGPAPFDDTKIILEWLSRWHLGGTASSDERRLRDEL